MKKDFKRLVLPQRGGLKDLGEKWRVVSFSGSL